MVDCTIHSINGRRRTVFIVCLMAAAMLLGGCSTFDYKVLADSLAEDPTTNASEFVNSYWEINQYHPKTGKRIFGIILHRNGVLENHHPNDITPADDRWSANGLKLTLRFNNSYAVYTAFQKEEGIIGGTAVNRTGDTWAWAAVRLPPPD